MKIDFEINQEYKAQLSCRILNSNFSEVFFWVMGNSNDVYQEKPWRKPWFFIPKTYIFIPSKLVEDAIYITHSKYQAIIQRMFKAELFNTKWWVWSLTPNIWSSTNWLFLIMKFSLNVTPLVFKTNGFLKQEFGWELLCLNWQNEKITDVDKFPLVTHSLFVIEGTSHLTN